MKKLWSLIFVLVLALGFSACEKEPPVTPPGPEPGPQGPTELPGSVTDLDYELNGYQEATLTWTNPEEEFELTGFVIKYRAEGGENAEITVDPDDYDAWPIEEFVVEGLEEQVYNFEVLTKNDYGTQKNGTALDGVKVYTLTGIDMPSFEIIEKSIGFVLSASNLSGATNVYYGMDWELKSSDGTVVASGENVIDEELFANIEAKNSTLANVDLPIDGVLDETEKYTVAYTLYAYPALGGTFAEGVYTYESILDMGDEPASVEGTAEGLSAEAEVEPMVIHFWGGDSQHAKYEKVLMTLPLIYHKTPDADGSYPVKAVKYKMYSGSAPDKIEVEKELAWDSNEWLNQTVDNSQVTALKDNYRGQWNGTLTYRLDCETYPAYVKAVAYDEFNRPIAMGQYYTYAYSVQASHEDILDHQPTFALVDNADGATYTFTAKHISAARAYAKKLSWKILNGSNVVAEGATAEVGVRDNKSNPALVDASWIVDATPFEAGNEYSVEYTIDYMPVLNSAEMGDSSPLDYDPATGIFTPALDPENPTGMTHDARILRDYVLDENGKIKYRVNAIENTDDKGYMHVATEGYTYRYLNHWNYNHCDPKVVTITSQDMLDAHSSMKAPAVVAPVLTGTLAEYDMKLVADVDEGTKFVRADFNNDWQNYTAWDGLKSVNGIYQGAKVSWNHTGAYKISKVVINGVEVTADGENKWSVDDKFVGSYVVEGLTTSPATIDVKVYSGEELLAEKSAEVEVYTLPETGSATFDVKYDAENGGWKLNSTGFSTEQYGTWKFSFNVYEKGSNTPVFENDVTKNSKDETLTYKGWISRGYLNAGQDISVSNSDYDDGCTPEFTGGSSDVFSGLKYGTEYEIRYKMQVWPIIFDSENAGNTETKFYYKKILMNSDSDEAFGTRTLEGTYEFTTEAATAEISVNAAAQGYQGAKLTWNEVAGAAYYKVAYGSTKIDAKVEATEYVFEPETLKDANKYKFTVTAYGADDAAISSATTEDVEIFTMCNYTEPVINFNEVEGGYQVVASNLVQLNYAYAGGATVTLKKDGEVVYVLKNNTGDGTLAAWAGYKRWALNAQDNRKDWKWTVNGTEEEKEVSVHAIEDGHYTVEWEWDYVVNKNGKWSNAESNGNFTVQEAKDETTKFVHFAGGTSDVLWVSSGVPYRVKKSGTVEATIGNAIPVAKMEVKADVAAMYQGAKLTWDAVEGASAIQIAYTVAGEKQLVEVAGDATEAIIDGTLTDASSYDFVVTALNDDEVTIAKGEVSTEVFTMFNYEAPELNLNKVEGGYQVVVGNLVEKNYAYVGGTLEFYKGEEKVYTLVNKTQDVTLNSWAGYGRWALNAMNNRKDWTWNDEGKEVNTHAIAAGDYTVKYTIEYAVNKNGTWATHNGSFVPQENEEGATYVYFANGKSDVLYDGSNAKRIVKSGEWTATVEAVAEFTEVTAAAAGYQNAKLTWNEVSGAASYKVATTGYESGAITATEFTIPENTLTAANKYKFTVTAYDAENAVLTSKETAETQVYTLTNRPEPVVTLADGVLTLANAEVNEQATKKDNLHIYGAALEAEIYFYKDGAATPAHTAKGTYLDSYPGANLALSYNEKKLKNNIAGAYTAWKWDGAAEATKTAPEFEAGVWTVKYKVGYHTFVNAAYGSDRLVFTAPTDALQTMIYREGNSDLTFTVEGEEPEVVYTTVAEFLAAPKDDSATATMYTLKGTITSVANTQYGNFDLTDDTGTVYIYGLMSPDGKTNKYWATSGAKLGDDIVIKTIRTDFNGTPQGTNAWFVELVSPGTRAFYNVDKGAISFPSAGGEEVVTVSKYNTDAAVSATSDNAKFVATVNGDKVTISAAANDVESEVTGNVTIKVGDLAETVVNVTLAAKPAAGVIEGGQADFASISSTNTSYVSGKTAAGWAYANCAIFKGGTSDASPAFKMIGDASNRALCMNGKTSAKGTITSPTLTTGCGTLKFNYGLPFGDTKIKFSVDIIQGGSVVKTFTVQNLSATKLNKYSHEEVINVAGDFQIVFSNLSPSNSTSNKDRTAVWDVEWTGYAEGGSNEPATPSFDITGTWSADYTNFSTTNAMYNTAHSGSGGAFTFVKLASEDGKSPKDGQKYYAQYKKYAGQDIYFDLDTKEIDGKPGCYALINLIDREAGSDKLTNNKSYYDSVNDVIYFDFVTEASNSPGTGTTELGEYTVAGFLWTAKMTR